MNNDIFSIIKSAGNPQAFLFELIQRQYGNNPIMRNVISLANDNNTQGIEALARNLCKERGIDPDAMFQDVAGKIRGK